MLVLSRKESQRIRLGDSIVITIVKISGDKVRVGIDAPTSILVLRDELELHETAAVPKCSGEETIQSLSQRSPPVRQSA
jgi:carbon storage regulator